MSQFPRSQAAIAGIGCTEFSKDSGVSVFNLAARAVKAAVHDAGLEVHDIDGLATFGVNDSIAPNFLAPALGMKSLNFYLNQFLGGSVSMSIIGQAALAVSAGVADCIVCFRALNGGRVTDSVAQVPTRNVRHGTSSSRHPPGTWSLLRRLPWPHAPTWCALARPMRT